jgi:hypothetical protein
MAMPHPRVMMIPFGCVIILQQNKKTALAKASMEIYTDPVDIDGLHAELNGRGAIITAPVNDDLPPNHTYTNTKIPAVIAHKTIKIVHKHTAYKVENKPGTKKSIVKGKEFQNPMLGNYFYWIERNAKPKPKAKPSKKK